MEDERPRRDFEAWYREGTPPWDIGRPQHEVVRLAEDGEFSGSVIDVGCGTGENALFLAARGNPTFGVDSSPLAVERARAKAAARKIAASFAVVDALDLSQLRRRFETALDCGLFHTFAPEDWPRYVRSLMDVLAPGGILHLLCFSDEEPPGPGPRRIARHEISDAFGSQFAVTRVRRGRFESHVHEGGARAWVATLVRL